VNHSDQEGATIEDVCQAYESLTNDELYRLHKLARVLLAGTEYSDPQDLLNETLVRTLRAANGEKGRHWPKSVPFVAFLGQTMKGLADDSLNSSHIKQTQEMEALATEALTADEAIGAHGHCYPDVVALAVEAGEIADDRYRAIQDAARIDAHFVGDDEVGWLVMGHKDDLKAAEIRELSGMDQTQYETARRRFRRGLEKVFPGRSQR
jgi:DNA-directed RNA polymerase specialized sigma24 family protein